MLLEAMAQGTPVVSTAVMGTADVLSGMHGATVAPENEVEFARLTKELLNAPGRRAALGRLAVADAEMWSSSHLTQRLLHLYQSVKARQPRDMEAA